MSDARKESGNSGNSKIKDVIISMRPRQWTKNGFVFAGLIFSKSFFNVDAILRVILAFFLFSLVSGALYIINDVIDREKDLHHPVKCKRPIASGRIHIAGAMITALLIIVVSLSASFYLDVKLFSILLAYSVLVFAYSIKLKNIVILDVIILSMGFVLRTAGGAVVIGVWISPWLILCTTLLALFLALIKRKNELRVLADGAANHRKILQEYSPELIDRMLSVVTSTTLMSYSLYTFSAGKSSYMMLTIPFVLYGIFRYQYLTSARDMGGSPELVLLQDKPLLIDIVLWAAACVVIVGFF
ncbi:MAG: phosphoribose diphosphate--decaprenyl-phosphate phosphoribosyltransferase [Clostridiales bacterium GWC2_40_7]|nr:MAG: phosphoribose diphosphate--decaprenyl-phosphate phosphoribosyltransferase [Clostridiales bacterium GWC2_40_7]